MTAFLDWLALMLLAFLFASGAIASYITFAEVSEGREGSAQLACWYVIVLLLMFWALIRFAQVLAR